MKGSILSKIKFKNSFFGVVLLVLVLLAVLIVILFLTLQKKKVTQIVEVPKDNVTEAAKKSLDWWDQKRDDRGYYYERVNCSNDTFLCDKPIKAGMSGHTGLSMIWARFKYYEKTKDLTELDKLKRDLKNYADGVEKMEVQNDFWNCKFMYEIWKSDLVDNETKDKADWICFTSTFLDDSDFESFVARTVEDDKYARTFTNVKGLAKDINFINPTQAEIESIKDNTVVQFADNFAFYVADFVARYKWRNNVNDFDLAKSTFNRVVAAYYLNKKNFSSKGICGLGVAALDFYNIDTNDKRYLDFAVNLYEEKNDTENSQIDSMNNPVCEVFASELYQNTNDQKYNMMAKETKTNLLEKYYDGTNLHNNKEAIGGFFETNPISAFITAKYVKENGLIIGELLSN